MIDASLALRVRIPFENVLLKPLKEHRIVAIIFEQRLPFIHEILPDRVKYLCRSLLLSTQNSQFVTDAIEIPLAFFAYGIGGCRKAVLRSE